MKQRATHESKPVGLFPFLAVLLCTMGALLVLLVVMAQRAGEQVLAEQLDPPVASEPMQIAMQDHSAEATALAEQLKEVRTYQEKLRKLREQAEERLQKEQLRLSHLEEHARRIEHELALLAIAAKQLEATENDQSVDQQQAESELTRLKQLILETEEQLESLREEATGERSYAIVPYQGPNGTFRQPIYIECSKEGVVIQPEGIRFERSDFVAPGWPGNPLAAALRASREYLNAKAAKAGKPEPPDPYPLLIVRPDGITQYQLARAALASWDADFGYEFVDGDWNLEFPDLPNPRLAQLQHHAQLSAREQLARLVRSAPRRFRGIGTGGGSSMASGGTSGSHGFGVGGESSEPNDFGPFAQSTGGETNEGLGGDGGLAESQLLSESKTTTGEFQHGALGGDPGGVGNRSQGSSQDEGLDSLADSTGEGSSASNQEAGSESSQGGSQKSGAEANSSGTLAQSGGQSAGGSAASGSSSSSSAAAGGQPSSSAAAAPSLSMSSQNVKNIAESRGKNWAVSQGARGAVAIRRPIHMVVRNDRLTLLPSRHAVGGIEATGTVISLNQPTQQVSDEFVEALRARVDGWGLAGNGLYWRPVLELRIGPEAEPTARGLAKLLQHSGVEVQRGETAPTGPSIQALKGDLDHATR